MKKIIMTVVKSLVILFGAGILIYALNDFFTPHMAGTDAGQSDALIGMAILAVIGIILIILPTVSIYRSVKKEPNSSPS